MMMKGRVAEVNLIQQGKEKEEVQESLEMKGVVSAKTKAPTGIFCPKKKIFTRLMSLG